MTQAQNEVMAQEPLRVLEAMLFASATPLSINAIRNRFPQDADIGGMLMDLQKTYEGRGVTLTEKDGNWAFRTAKDVGEALQVTREVKRKLSRAAMETLAIIAYHQPVTRAEIENIRGVITHKGMLDILIECGWVKPGRRRETPGRPLTWVTTAAFLDHFGLEALTDLPGLDDLKASGLLDRRPAIDSVAITGNLFAAEDGQIEDDAEFDEEDDDGSDEVLESAAAEDESDDDFSDEDEFEDDDEEEEDF